MRKMILSTAIVLAASIGFAHSDHAHKPVAEKPLVADCGAAKCSEAQIEAAVPKALQTLVDSGKRDASWTKAKFISAKKAANGLEWMATVENEKATDEKQKRLYVFITNSGRLNGSNFDGK